MVWLYARGRTTPTLSSNGVSPAAAEGRRQIASGVDSTPCKVDVRSRTPSWLRAASLKSHPACNPPDPRAAATRSHVRPPQQAVSSIQRQLARTYQPRPPRTTRWGAGDRTSSSAIEGALHAEPASMTVSATRRAAATHRGAHTREARFAHSRGAENTRCTGSRQ